MGTHGWVGWRGGTGTDSESGVQNVARDWEQQGICKDD